MSIEEIFKEHWEEKQNLPLTTVAEQSGDIEEVIKAYEDRVIFELLQNALDKAEDTILVKVIDNILYIANDDGKRMTFAQDGDSDFKALCSIHNSNKKSSEAIGNKGIGFKSVFSSSSDGSVTIYAKPDKPDNFIAFKYYGKIDKNIVEKEKKYKENLFIQEQLKNKKKFIPGFYYPILLKNESLDDVFRNYVTVIKIPLKAELNIQLLFNEIKEKHFYFISTKGNRYKNIQINFQPNDKYEFIKKTSNKEKLIIGSFQSLSKLQKLSQEAGLSGEIPNISIYLNENKTTNIYTYLPTKMKSPFFHCDINSDFQTKENRESMDFDKSGKISKYNKALLTACIELHFLMLSKYLDNFDDYLKLEYIENDNIEKNDLDKDNFWKYLQLNEDPIVKKETIRIIKKIFNDDWNEFGIFISKLAKKYFDKKNNLTIKNFDDFWKVIKEYTEIISELKSYTKTFKYDLKKYFLDNLFNSKACIIPITFSDTVVSKQKSLSDKIFFKDDNEAIELSEKLNIYLTNYKFSELGYDILLDKNTNCTIKRITNPDEILKHFRQISRSGEISKEYITEDEQKKIVKSLFNIYLEIKVKYETSTHRYYEILENSTKRQANFSISTIFLKVGEKKYKPSQFCYKDEIDKSFLDFDIPEAKKNKSIDEFLKFLGVSFDSNIRYTDFEKNDFFKGLDDIPLLYKKENEKNNTSYSDNIKIYYCSKDSEIFEIKHPALFYTTHVYNPILTEIKNSSFEDKKSLSLVVKSLKDYPKGYIDQIVSILKEPNIHDAKSIFKIYLEIFKKYNKKYLIYSKEGIFEWKEKLTDEKIAKTKKDFNILKNKVDILGTFSDVSKYENLKQHQAEIEYEINDNKNKDNTIKLKLETKIIDILILISESYLSEYDFRENDNEYNKKLTELNDKWVELNFYRLDAINPKIILNNVSIGEEKINEPIKIKKEVYFTDSHKSSDFADMLSNFFNVHKLRDSIKLILLNQKQYFNKEDIGIIASKWLKINDNKQKLIIKELKNIGFKDNIKFELKYTKDNFDYENSSKSSQDEIQELINEILAENKLRDGFIRFDCETKNEFLIQQFKNKYNLVIKEHSDIKLDKIDLKVINLDIKKEFDHYDFDVELNRINQNNIPKSNLIENNSLEPKSIVNNSKPHAEYSVEEKIEHEKVQDLINIAKHAKGSLAEKIFAKFVSDKTESQRIKDILEDDTFVIRKDWTEIIKHLNEYDGSNFENLIISQKHTGAGFDVVGIENNELIAYEIKAIDINNIYLYLTKNEIETFKRLGDRWRLIGVDEKKNEHINLTKYINILIDENNNPLKILNDKGFDIDSLICKIQQIRG